MPRTTPTLTEVLRRYGHLEETILQIFEELAPEDERAVPALASMMTSKNSKTRRRAKRLLVGMPAPSVAAELDDAMKADDAKIRLSAAELLYEMPPSDPTYQRARRALDVEEAQEVRDVLDRVEAPDADMRRSSLDSATHRKCVAALDESSGAAWENLSTSDDIPDDEVIFVYWDFMTERFRRQETIQ